jgi:O-antigen/teichoic acid export membrane protein
MAAARQGEESGRRPPPFAAAAATTYGAQLLAAALSFVSVLIVSRALGPSGRGDVAFLITVAVLSSNFALLGVQEANANFAASDPSQRSALATNSLLLSGLTGGGCVALLVVLLAAIPSFGPSVAGWLVALALGSVVLLVLQTQLQFLIAAEYGFGSYNLSLLIPPFVNVTVNGFLAAIGELGVGAAYVTWVSGQVLATLLVLWIVARRLAGFGRPDAALARRALMFGFKAHLGRLMMFANYRIDQWFVGAISGSRELGLYSIAVAWSEVLFYLPTALVVVQRPYLVRAAPRDAARRAAVVFRAGLVLTALLTGAVLIAAPFLCERVFGPDFRGATDDLRVLALGAFGIVAVKQLGNALTAQRRPGLASLAAGVTLVVTVALDIALIPPHGGLGAALASTISYTAGGLAAAFFFVRVFRAPPSGLIPRATELPFVVRELARSFRSRPGGAIKPAGD